MPNTTVRHPAKYTDALLPVFAELLAGRKRVLDPFGGTGKLKAICPDAVCMDIEPEWAAMAGLCADALRLPFEAGQFDAICTSPTYGNRMADTYTDGTHRITYTNYIGRHLSENNSGKMQWGLKYRQFHEAAYAEFRRVCRGVVILNVKDHIRAGETIPVCDWHSKAMGLPLAERRKVEVSGNRFGQNREKRMDYEEVMVFCA